VVVVLWIQNRAIQDLPLGPTGSDALGRLAGLLASDLMLLQVLLMARIPWWNGPGGTTCWRAGTACSASCPSGSWSRTSS